MLGDDANLFVPHIFGVLQLMIYNCIHNVLPGCDTGVGAEGSVVVADRGEGRGCSACDGGQEGEEQCDVLEEMEGHEESRN